MTHRYILSVTEGALLVGLLRFTYMDDQIETLNTRY